MKPCGHAAPGTAWTSIRPLAHPAPLAWATLRVAHIAHKATRNFWEDFNDKNGTEKAAPRVAIWENGVV